MTASCRVCVAKSVKTPKLHDIEPSVSAVPSPSTFSTQASTKLILFILLTGMILYELHVPLMLFTRSRYEYNEITKEEYKKRMQEVEHILEEAVNILILEDPSSAEGSIGQVGKESLQQLKSSIAQL